MLICFAVLNASVYTVSVTLNEIFPLRILFYTRKNEQLDQCCQQLVAMLCCTLSTTVVNNHCSQWFTFNNRCSIIVDNDQQAFFINYCRLMF